MDGTLPPPRIDERPAMMRLSPGWSRTMFVGWCGIIAAMACTGISSHIIGRPVFWLDDQRWSALLLSILIIVVAAPLVICALWSYGNRPWIPLVSGASTVVLVVVALVDRNNSPGAAVVEGVLAGAGLLLSIASLTVRHRTSPHQ